jgi:hypothetical protein
MNSRISIARRTAASLLCATMFTSPAFAGTLVGTVVDASGTRGLQGAEVELVELGRRMAVAPDGTYRFFDVPEGKYTLKSRYAGAADSSILVSVTKDGTTRTDIALGSE